MHVPAIVLDCGSSFTRMGFSDNSLPSLSIPTAVGYGDSAAEEGTHSSKPTLSPSIDDLNLPIGREALAAGKTHSIRHPIREGRVQNWDSMEHFLQAAIFHYLRVDPESHPFLFSEPPLAPPEDRELLAEVMFETFSVPALHIGAAPVLALYAHSSGSSGSTANTLSRSALPSCSSPLLTGVVVDSGDSTTTVTPVVEGVVVGGAVRSIPVAGRHATALMLQLLRGRDPPGAAATLPVAQVLKERFAYVASSEAQEWGRQGAHPEKYVRRYGTTHPQTGAAYELSVSSERFLVGGLPFCPGVYAPTAAQTPLHAAVDAAVQACPIDLRRGLYANIVLAGGATAARSFDRRLGQELGALCGARLSTTSTPMLVHVRPWQPDTVWGGGALLAETAAFPGMCHTREQYMESGARVLRSGY
ncbi:MAG: hypothetical protein WDW36_008685 [Sanguina aurantia]